MIYYRNKISSFTKLFDTCSIIILSGKSYSLLQKEAKKFADEIAGLKADDEMRITRYFNQEIGGNKHAIISSLKTKSFFPGRQIILLNDLSDKDYKIISEIDAEWQKNDSITIVTMRELSKNFEFKKLV